MNLWPKVLIFWITLKIAEKLPTVENMKGIDFFFLKNQKQTYKKNPKKPNPKQQQTLKHNR